MLDLSIIPPHATYAGTLQLKSTGASLSSTNLGRQFRNHRRHWSNRWNRDHWKKTKGHPGPAIRREIRSAFDTLVVFSTNFTLNEIFDQARPCAAIFFQDQDWMAPIRKVFLKDFAIVAKKSGTSS